MKKIFPILAFCLLFFYSCRKNEKQAASHSKTDSVKAIKKDTAIADPEVSTESFKTAVKAEDLVPNGYEIQYDTEGDLNQDGLLDKAMVLRKKDDSLSERKMIILLRNADKTYRLDKTSDKVFPAEYNEYGYKMHDPEDISITKGELHINLYDIGPNGNLFSKFKYLNGALILTYVETYNMGAGSHSALYYEPMKGKVIHETVNTMEEDMPSQSKTILLKKEQYLFEKTSPEEVVIKVYNMIDHE
ncbi:hypothetical protein [Chryseobacterium indologenes]|uniref:Lipoprotein n=1 Tax=Chryseobacterium indologenes TaxID=253 RepID=A0A0N0IU84_CHRID|nr:hypothetical protein [Chryseobacterium indologenes]KPE49413.1 hypothetical protein AOB46_19760 [Chryseobacterium indologenes]